MRVGLGVQRPQESGVSWQHLDQTLCSQHLRPCQQVPLVLYSLLVLSFVIYLVLFFLFSPLFMLSFVIHLLLFLIFYLIYYLW